jgi:hypothetical protein
MGPHSIIEEKRSKTKPAESGIILACFKPQPDTPALLPRVFISTLCLTPLMVYFFIPLSTRLLANWLNSTPHRRSHTGPICIIEVCLPSLV